MTVQWIFLKEKTVQASRTERKSGFCSLNWPLYFHLNHYYKVLPSLSLACPANSNLLMWLYLTHQKPHGVTHCLYHGLLSQDHLANLHVLTLSYLITVSYFLALTSASPKLQKSVLLPIFSFPLEMFIFSKSHVVTVTVKYIQWRRLIYEYF